jgi:hypothetical protein
MPGLARQPRCPAPSVGGVDFGFRNPFAAVWGHVLPGDILCITGERYGSGQPLVDHLPFLPTRCFWYCDPSGPGERVQMRRAGFSAVAGNNAIREGIAAVTGRIQSARLRIDSEACPMLADEGTLYQYDPDETLQSETPIDRDNHALSALRYLVMGLLRKGGGQTKAPGPPKESVASFRSSRDMLRDESCWTTFS